MRWYKRKRIGIEEVVPEHGEDGPAGIGRLFYSSGLIVGIAHRIFGPQPVGALGAEPAVLQHGTARVGDRIERRVFDDAAAAWADDFLRGLFVSNCHGDSSRCGEAGSDTVRYGTGRTRRRRQHHALPCIQRNVHSMQAELPHVPNWSRKDTGYLIKIVFHFSPSNEVKD